MKLALVINKEFRQSVEKLARQPVRLSVAYKLKSILKRINEEFSKFEECRNEALVRFGNKDEEGKLIVDERGGVGLTAENMDLFNKEISELANMDVDCGTVRLADLDNDLTLTTEDIMYLEGIIDES